MIIQNDKYIGICTEKEWVYRSLYDEYAIKLRDEFGNYIVDRINSFGNLA